MSRIFTKWKCDNCKEQFDRYVSFGHPDKDFVYRWQCKKCGYVNKLKVRKWPRSRFW